MPRVVVLALFVLSGAAGLVYEVVWSRQLVLVFGNTTQAVSAILTGFFGGLAIGSYFGGRLADRVRRPLRLYGILEIVLVAVVVLTPISFGLIREAYRGVYGTLVDQPEVLALVRFGLALLALAPATVLMGATLPTLTKALDRSGEHMSASFSRLYAANTIGAILGTLISGFFLIELLGLSRALVVGAAGSALAGVGALLLDRRLPAPAAAAPGFWTERPISGRRWLALGIAFVSGLTSLGYQTLWTRLLAGGTGNSTYVFTLILGIFLIGIAIGAVVFAVIRSRVTSPVALLAASQLLVAVLVLVGMATVIARHHLDPLTALGDVGGWLTSFAFTVVVAVLPTTIVMGLMFPASSALLADDDHHAGTESGTLLAANTLGSITGTFVIPFFVIPLIGSPASVALLAGVNLLTAVVLGSLAGRVQTRRLISLATTAIAVLLAFALTTGTVFANPNLSRISEAGGTVYASAEDEIAPVEAAKFEGFEQLFVTGTSMTVLTIDTHLMPVIPLMLRPNAKEALVVAFGMGTAYRAALAAGLQVDGVELVPSVPKMFRYFYADADQVLANPAGKLHIADGRNYVELTNKTYDIVITDPPPPVESSGVSVIASLEYYEAVKRRLNPGGVMVEWVPYNQTLDEFLAQVRTFARVFPHMRVNIGLGGWGFYMIGSDQPVEFDPATMAEILNRPSIVADVAGSPDLGGRDTARIIEQLQYFTWLKEDQIGRVVGDGPLITDDQPLPEYFLLRRLANPDEEKLSLSGLDRIKRAAGIS